jgi:glycosyltransferase involved in cell wall biosynthesis
MELKNVMNESKKITFCINTAKNEKEYIQLLLGSLLNGIDVDFHDILVFVDSDNQGTSQMLVEQKPLFPNLTIVKNNGDPIGYQKNINWMFEFAKTDIVSYLQSDMVVGLNYDKAILSHIEDNMILSGTRVEPPLHSKQDTQVNYVENFGLTPDEFQYEEFLKYVEVRKDPNKLINYFFAPFTLYKHVWNDIGGHDVQFVKSREDSDVLLRLCLNKCNIVQCWDAFVYHFTCTSSRGIDWWKSAEREQERQKNDQIELQRFIAKWGTFVHPNSYEMVYPLIQHNPKILDNIIVKNPPIDNSNFELI